MNTPHPSLIRRAAKFALFVTRGVAPQPAWWLACRDAVKRNDYRRVPLACLDSAYRADPSWQDLVASDGTIRSASMALPFVANDLLSLDYATLQGLRQHGFEVTRDGSALVATNRTWRLRFTTAEHLSMAREIFLEGCYDLRLAGNWVVLDVGANIGLASLFFAAQPWVNHVVAFEPFPPTQADNLTNTSANPMLAAKISLRRYGLSDQAAHVAVDYDPQWSGSMSVAGLGSWRDSSTSKRQKVEIELQPASEVLESVRVQFTGCRVLAKIDCEGSEYAILRELAAKGKLSELDVIVMEWHAAKPDELVQLLQQSGFALQVRPLAADGRLGLILAWRPQQP